MERSPDRFSTTDDRAMIVCRGQSVQRAARMSSAQNARSGLAMLAPEPHRTTRRPASTERRTAIGLHKYMPIWRAVAEILVAFGTRCVEGRSSYFSCSVLVAK
jgi:hypothetical protein